MKSLTTYISQVKNLHSLNEYIAERLVINQRFDEKLIIFPSQVNEKLIINKSFKDNTIKVVSKQQLGGIIYKRLAENPEELYLNDLDVSSIKDFSGIFSSYIFSELIISLISSSNSVAFISRYVSIQIYVLVSMEK